MKPKDSVRSPLVGYNHNLKYKGRVFHIQTEDSGLRAPHVFTHLFYDGTILATKKTDYDHLLDAPDWEEKVRELMKAQHKDMMKELIRGVYDERIEALLGPLEPADREVRQAEAHPADREPAQPARPERRRPAHPLPPGGLPPRQQTRPARATGPISRSSRQGPPPPKVRPPQEQAGAPPVVVAAPVVVVTDIGTNRPRRPTQPRLPAEERVPPPEFKPEESRSIPTNVFGETSDDKSLDEVLLAYLAEEMGDTPPAGHRK